MRRLERSSFGPPLIQRDFDGIRVSTTAYAALSALPFHEHGHGYLCLIAEGAYHQICPGHEDECRRGLLLVHPQGHRHRNRFHLQGARSLDLFFSPAWQESKCVRRLLSDYRKLRLPGWERLIMRLERELVASDDAAELAVQAAVLDLIAQAIRFDEGARRPTWMPRVLERLHDAPRSVPSLGELATLAGVHPAHLARTFKRLHGLSIGEYHRNLRVALACRAMRDSSRSIAAIATEAGFSDQSHFARVFKQLTGQVPSDYRRSMQIRS